MRKKLKSLSHQERLKSSDDDFTDAVKNKVSAFLILKVIKISLNLFVLSKKKEQINFYWFSGM